METHVERDSNRTQKRMVVDADQGFKGKNLNILNFFNGLVKKMGGWQLCYKFSLKCQMVVEGQGSFRKHLLPRLIPPEV